MEQKIVLLFNFIISLLKDGEGMALPGGGEFRKRLCATKVGTFNHFGPSIKTGTCRSTTATESLSGTPHWCFQDYLKVIKDSRTFLIPSGCSVWVKETDEMPMAEIDTIDKTGLKRLSPERLVNRNITGGIVETKECEGEGLNSGSNDLRGTDHWCRQQKIDLNFGGVDSVSSGCSCYVR